MPPPPPYISMMSSARRRVWLLAKGFATVLLQTCCCGKPSSTPMCDGNFGAAGREPPGLRDCSWLAPCQLPRTCLSAIYHGRTLILRGRGALSCVSDRVRLGASAGSRVSAFRAWFWEPNNIPFTTTSWGHLNLVVPPLYAKTAQAVHCRPGACFFPMGELGPLGTSDERIKAAIFGVGNSRGGMEE